MKLVTFVIEKKLFFTPRQSQRGRFSGVLENRQNLLLRRITPRRFRRGEARQTL